jgi:hypothetical protein
MFLSIHEHFSKGESQKWDFFRNIWNKQGEGGFRCFFRYQLEDIDLDVESIPRIDWNMGDDLEDA